MNAIPKLTDAREGPDVDKLADLVMLTQRTCLLDLTKELNKGSVSFPQFYLLGYLSTEESMTMSEIAGKMGHSTAAATGLVDRLEKLGYVERIHAADDRRKILVQITAKGEALLLTLRAALANSLSSMMADLDGDDKSLLTSAFQR
ncbi:MAG: MarR family transcriptional regulator [Verrucomicrobiota bacterium]